MNLKMLFEMCSNLGHGSWFEVYTFTGKGNKEKIDEGDYTEMYAKYGDCEIIDFEIVHSFDVEVTIYREDRA